MAEMKKIATRDSFGNALVELGEREKNLVVLSADVADATRTEWFGKTYPERFFNCGIAEANMICAAAGMSSMGLTPFVSAFAMFAAGRAFEQIRNTLGYPGCNVKIGATHGGISVGEDGASHQCCEDFALMRAIPGMVVLSPSDDIEAKAAVKAAYYHNGPVYIRFGRLAVPVVHEESGYTYQIGKGEVLADGKDLSILATGLMVAEALEASRQLAKEGISLRVVNMGTIKPLDTEIVLKAAKETGKIITAEEHSIVGGLGEAVCSFLAENCPTPVKRIGVNDVYGHSGPALDLLKQFGLSSENIVKTAKSML